MLGTEVLDDPRADPTLVRAELNDLERLNRLFGGTRAVVRALEPIFAGVGERKTDYGERWTLLDVGTGAGDIPCAAQQLARRYGIDLTLLGVERIPTAARVARSAGLATVLADGGALPFAPRSVDIVIASQVLHHVPTEVAVRWIAALDCVARRAVVVADLRRSGPAMAGLWLASFALRLHPATRHDAVLSLRRGYTRKELDHLLRCAGVVGDVRGAPIARLVAVWRPASVVRNPSSERKTDHG
jgi:2-polyprenyl-3-methyl-5-hydroxy-6-metoxy-1,4-benzoquinol methylase